LKNEILKYFSGMFSEDEEKQFLQRLKTDENLKKKFEETKRKLELIDSFGAEKEVTTGYFETLIPKVRKEIEPVFSRRKGFKLSPAFSFAFFTLLAFFFFSQFFNSSFYTRNDIERILNSGKLTPAQSELVDYYLENQLYAINIIDSTFTFDFNNQILPNEPNNFSDYYEASLLNDNELFNIIDDKEYNEIYNELKKLKLF